MTNSGFLTMSEPCCSSRHFRSCAFAGMLFLLCLCLSGCSTPTEFRVLDSKTSKPVEGAVALATWTAYGGLPGLSYGYTAKAVEAVSNKDGYFTIPGVICTLAFNPPLLQVYKPGYVGWNSRKIYLGFHPNDRKLARTKKRENFVWKERDIYLRRWKYDGTMNHYTHWDFVAPDGDTYRGGIKKSKYYDAISFDDDLRYQEIVQWDKEK